MDDESGDDERDGLTSGWGGESRQDWWGWRNESGSWFQRRGDAYLNERSVIFKQEMVGGRERMIIGEERVLRGGWSASEWLDFLCILADITAIGISKRGTYQAIALLLGSGFFKLCCLHNDLLPRSAIHSIHKHGLCCRSLPLSGWSVTKWLKIRP